MPFALLRQLGWRLLASTVLFTSFVALPGVSSAGGPAFAPEELLVGFYAGLSETDQEHVYNQHGGRKIEKLRGLNVHRIRVPANSIDAVARKLQRHPAVKFIERNEVLAPSTAPTDPYFADEWHLTKIMAPEAWTFTLGSSDLIIAFLDSGIDVTALHNPFFWDDPRLYYMHVHGFGKAADLAHRIKPALDLIGHVPPTRVAPSFAKGTPLDVEKLAKIVGHAGEQSGAVYKITVGRDDLAMKDHGASINASMGLNTWAAFLGTQEDAVIAGDVAMLENEVTPVLKTLRKNGFDVVAIHHHMTDEMPMVIFLHYWARGSADKLADGFKAVLDILGKQTPSHA